MSADWPAFSYEDWSATADTVHAHAQVLGKVALALAPPEPQLQHSALRLTARGIETAPLPAPDGSGALAVLLDLRAHETLVEHSDGRAERVRLTPNRAVGEVTRNVLDAIRRLGGDVKINPTPQEVAWRIPLDRDHTHRRYDPVQVGAYFAAATQAALVLAEVRAAYRGRKTPVNAWWGSFDLAVNFFSGRSAAPPSEAFIPRNSMDAEEIAVGWWPGDPRHRGAAFYAYAHPAPAGFASATLEPDIARWDGDLGEFILEWDDLRTTPDPRQAAVDFALSAFRHACDACGWDPALAATAEGRPPPVA
jgi:hypothetical protein